MPVDTVDPKTYKSCLTELTAMQTAIRRLETCLLKLMNEAGITDEAIATELDISSQAVGKRRRRKV